MEPEILKALLEAEMVGIKEQRLTEIAARDVLSNKLAGELATLFPGVSAQFQDANFNFVNELQRGAGEIVDQVASARINWTGPVKDSGVDEQFTSELIRMMTTDALVSGKMAIYPRIDEDGDFVFEVPTGYLHPIFAPGNALKVAEVLQVVPMDGGSRFQVTRFSRGMVQVYPPVSDWLKFADGTPEDFAQSHAPDRLPIVFRVVKRDAHRVPVGLASEALSGFRRYAKSAINRNAVQEVAGFPERIVKSDTYLSLLLGRVVREGVGQGQEDPAITALKQTGPNKLKVLGTEDVYEVAEGVDLAPHTDAERSDKLALLDQLRSPDLSGGNVTEVALAERQGKARALILDLTATIARMGTEACALASEIAGSEIGAGITLSLTPSFPSETAKRPSQVSELFGKSALKLSHVWLELQSVGWNSITDGDIEAQQAAEKGDALPDVDA